MAKTIILENTLVDKGDKKNYYGKDETGFTHNLRKMGNQFFKIILKEMLSNWQNKYDFQPVFISVTQG